MRARGLNLQISSKSKTIDFEEKLYDLDQAENRLRTVDAFINTDGGHYYIGIKDDGKALGLNKTMVNEQVQLFHRNVKEHISPLPRYEFIYHEIEKDIFVIEILITKSIELPVLLTFHGIPSIYVREEGRNRPASRNEIVNLVLASKVESFDDVLTDEIFDKNNFNILFDTYKKQNDEPLTDKKLISNLFMNEDKLLKTGSILFKDDYKGNDTSLKITKRNGLSKGENAFKNLLDIHENIISSINKAFGVIKENIGYIEQKEYFGRKTIYDYPLRSIFEGLVNAFAHKNYFLKNSVIEIDIFKNRLEISSPGGLTTNLDLIKEKDIDNIKPTRRNEVIANVLTLCNYMEKEGSGFDKISEDYRLMDDNHKPFVTAKDNYFLLTLPNINYEEGIESDNPAITCLTEELLSDKQLKILSYCYISPKTTEEIAKFLNISLSTYFRKNILSPLVEDNLLIRNSKFKSDLYYTNHETIKIK